MSELFNLNIKDYLKSFVVMLITAILTALLPIIQGGQFPTFQEVKGLLLTSLLSGISYLIKNFLTNSRGFLLTKEPM
jgi:hypothetical protein